MLDHAVPSGPAFVNTPAGDAAGAIYTQDGRPVWLPGGYGRILVESIPNTGEPSLMRIVVQKYGGSSVADLDRIRAVAGRIAAARADGTAVCVVVSAMGNTTNELLALARDIAPRPDWRELDMLISSVGERVTMALLAMCPGRLRYPPARSLTGSQSGIVTDESHTNAQVVEVRPFRVRPSPGPGQRS